MCEEKQKQRYSRATRRDAGVLSTGRGVPSLRAEQREARQVDHGSGRHLPLGALWALESQWALCLVRTRGSVGSGTEVGHPHWDIKIEAACHQRGEASRGQWTGAGFRASGVISMNPLKLFWDGISSTSYSWRTKAKVHTEAGSNHTEPSTTHEISASREAHAGCSSPVIPLVCA